MCVVATEMLHYNADHLVIAKEVYSQISTDLLTILDKIAVLIVHSPCCITSPFEVTYVASNLI